MATITLRTNNKSMTLDSSISPSKPYLAVNYNGVTYKNSLSTQNNGDFRVNLNGVTYKTRGNEPSTDQLQFNDNGVLTSFTTTNGIIFDKTNGEIITPSSSVSVSGSDDVIILWAHGGYIQNVKEAAFTFLNSHLTELRNTDLIAYEGKLINAPRNYSEVEFGTAEVAYTLQTSSSYSPYFTSFSVVFPQSLTNISFLADFIDAFNALVFNNFWGGYWGDYYRPTSVNAGNVRGHLTFLSYNELYIYFNNSQKVTLYRLVAQ